MLDCVGETEMPEAGKQTARKILVRQPIFVGGCARSGTTMLGAILGEHSSAVCIPESLFKRDLLNLWAREPDATWDDIRRTMQKSPSGFIALFEDIPQVSGPLEKALAGYLDWYVEQFERKRNLKPVAKWVDHTPHNIELAEWLLRAYPSARFIHIVRDGRAVAASLKKVDWGPKTVYYSADEWIARVGGGLAAEDYFRERIMRVHYEDLVRKPERTVRTLCDFLGWPFEQEMIEKQGFAVAAAYKAQHLLVGQYPDKLRIDAWKQALSSREVEVFEAYAGAMLGYLGYERNYPIAARPLSRTGRVMTTFYELWLRKWRLISLTRTRLRSRRRLRSRKE
jgi:sulfotransferase family protein